MRQAVLYIGVFLLSLFLVSCGKGKTPVYSGFDILSSDSTQAGEKIGHVLIVYTGDYTEISVSLYDQDPKYPFAIHIHEGDCDNLGKDWNAGLDTASCNAISMGNKWNKLNIGDVGNLFTNGDGYGNLTVYSDLWTLGTGDHDDLMNKTIVIYQGFVDFVRECDPDYNPTHTHYIPIIGCGQIK